MTRILLLIFLMATQFSNAQITEVWKKDRLFGVYFDFSEMRIVGSNIYIHSTTQYANSNQYGQSITTDGTENWFLTHDQENECSNCGNASTASVAISSIGDGYSVGQQDASPYPGKYFSKINAAGELVFANEFLTNPWSSGFTNVCLSGDETFLYASGYQYAPELDGLGTQIYKLSLDGEISASQLLLEEFSSISSLVSNSSNQVFCDVSMDDTLRFASFNSDLQVNWVTKIAKPGFSISSGSARPIFLSNGDLLFINHSANNQEQTETRVNLTRVTQSGDIVWQTEHILGTPEGYQYFSWDFTTDASDNVFCYYYRVLYTGGKGGIAEENGNLDGRAGSNSQIRPALLKFNNQGIYQWTYIENGNSIDETGTVYNGNVIADENGYAIISAFQDPFQNEGVTYTILKPSGDVETTIYIDDFKEHAGKGMVYAGNRTFYTHTIARNLENLSESSWVVARYQYEVSTGISTIKSENDFELYPNPANGFVTVQSKNTKELNRLKITDLSGRAILEIPADKSGKTIVSLDGISAGMYVVSNGINSLPMIIN